MYSKLPRILFFTLLLMCGKLQAQQPFTDTAGSLVPLTGYVDMHAHPRGDLAYGDQLFYGAPYGDISVALGSCKEDHSKNLLRAVLAEQTEQQYNKNWKDSKQGYPNFTTWPAWCSILHQQMWVDWIKRAHELGGLNIMVALAVGNHCIASAAGGNAPYDDEDVLLSCIQGIKDLVAHSDFMEIALTPADVRRIVTSGKLAIILGSEMDNIGNFYSPADHYKASFNPTPTNEEIQAELDKLWNLGVRYIFPVHLMNNFFGGTSLIMGTLNVANKFSTGAEYIPEKVSTKETGIAFRLEHPATGLNAMAKMFMPLLLPKNVNPARIKNYTFWDTIPGYGMRNSEGITERGRFAIKYMMHKGFLIDIDHMSEKMADEVLKMALQNNYPVNSGHNGPRTANGTEFQRTLQQYAQLKQLGGMVGLDHANNATEMVELFHKVAQIMGYAHIAVGTDVGGFSPQPRRDTTIHLVYSASFPACKTGNRTWDINVDGVAHYGLWADYIHSWPLAGLTSREMKTFMSSAEDFTEMWEKCENRKQTVTF
ncbi:MAG TPA: membrane dipeptidase [Chitinophagales bacterium]|nr:membrane dipeptidase [Chitinophagales bacterium]